MGPRPYVLAETNWLSVKNTKYQVAILPWGATEAHNYHLPYSTDNLQVTHIATESARKAWRRGAKPIVLPTVPYGVNTGQFDVTLDINMMPSTQLALLRDISQVLCHQKIYKLVVLNGHGGNSFKQMIREVGVQFPQMFISEVNWFKVLDGTDFFVEPGDHASELETSLVMHLSPNLVRPLAEAGDGGVRESALTAVREGWAWTERRWLEATYDTGAGNPSQSSPEKGERFLEALTNKLSSFLEELSELDLGQLYLD